MPDRSFFVDGSRLLLLAIFFAGCSTVSPVRTDRHGLFEQLARGTISRQPFSKTPERRPAEALRRANLNWPLRDVRVTSKFGQRGVNFHEGIDLRAPTGTTVYAAQSGQVVYADRRIRGYGRMVVLQHKGGYATVYAHNSKILVKKGQKVKQGQKIAVSGNSGHTTGPHLHFEIRYGVSAVDPLDVLPKSQQASVESVTQETAVATRE